jgi:vancomycin aglycone glucosyltransferase
MRIALAVEGTRGDVHPLLSLGERFQRAGHEVRVCAPPDFEGDARERGFEFRAIGPSVREFLDTHADAIAGGGLHALRECDRYTRRALAWQLACLPDAIAGADRLFAAGVQFGAASAAELQGIPYRYLVYCPTLFPSREHAPFLLPVATLPAWGNRVAWALLRLFMWTQPRRLVNRARRRVGLPPVRDLFRHWLGQRPILAADAELAPAPRDWRSPVVQIPCLHPLRPEPLPAKLESFLDAGPPPVVVGFGSMTDPDPARTTAAILQAVSSLGCRAIVSRGWARLGGAPLPEGVMEIGPVSHAALFPRAAAVVHHGGAGTTTTAARAGVPQLLVPHLLDQFYWAGRVQRLGLGPTQLPRPRLTARSLATSLAEIFGNELLAERARSFGERLCAAAQDTPSAEVLLAT